MTTSLKSLKRLKQIDSRIKHAVFGYVRSMESELVHRNIPFLISYLCLSYYYHNEYFSKHSDKVELSNNNMTITKIIDESAWYNTTYGNTWIDSNVNQIAKWTLKLSGRSDNVFICIVSKDNRMNEECYRLEDEPVYLFCNTVTFKMEKNGICKDNDDYDWAQLFHGTITLILNTKDRTIEFKNIESSERKIMFKNIKKENDIKYKLAINLHDKGDSVSLIDFDLALQ